MTPPPPQPSPPPAIRSGLVVALVVLGWLVVLGLTAVALTRYRVTGPSASSIGDVADYVNDIRDRLAHW